MNSHFPMENNRRQFCFTVFIHRDKILEFNLKIVCRFEQLWILCIHIAWVGEGRVGGVVGVWRKVFWGGFLQINHSVI